MKKQIIKALSSSKNERICFEVIYNLTTGSRKLSRLILNDCFYQAGVSTRKALNLAVNRLVDKGLIIKRWDQAHNYEFDCYRYMILEQGCSHFLERCND